MLFQQTLQYSPIMNLLFKAVTKDMILGQIKAIFDKYLEERPEVWHKGAAGLFYNALMENNNEK